MQQPVPQTRFRELVKAVCAGTYSEEDLARIEDWDVSRVTDFSYMFSNAEIFNQELENWNTSRATNMRGPSTNPWRDGTSPM